MANYIEIKYRGITVYGIIPFDYKKEFYTYERAETIIRCNAVSILRHLKNDRYNESEYNDIYDSIEELLYDIKSIEDNSKNTNNNDIVCGNKIVRISPDSMIYATIPSKYEEESVIPEQETIINEILDVLQSFKPGDKFSIRYHEDGIVYFISDCSQPIGNMTKLSKNEH